MIHRLFIMLTASIVMGAVLFFPALAKTPAQSLVLLKNAPVISSDGTEIGSVKPFDCLVLLGERPGRWLVAFPAAGPSGSSGLIERQAAVSVPGTPESHRPRLARLKKAGLSQGLTRRLAQGRIQAGDTFYLVELAWGDPQRSFMVNYFSDEMHYVYFRPGRTTVLLKFKSGRLSHEPKPRPSRR